MSKKVRFTGARTGRERITVPRFGQIEVGQVVEVADDVAERWLVPMITRRRLSPEEYGKDHTKEEVVGIIEELHPHLGTSGTKTELIERLHAHDATLFGAPPLAEFELVDDDAEPDVVKGGNRVGSAPDTALHTETIAGETVVVDKVETTLGHGTDTDSTDTDSTNG